MLHSVRNRPRETEGISATAHGEVQICYVEENTYLGTVHGGRVTDH